MTMWTAEGISAVAVMELHDALLLRGGVPLAAAGPDHVSACTEKLERLLAQRRDLASCLDRLLADVCEGRAYFKVYRQFKMYNDPALNPYLYGGAAR